MLPAADRPFAHLEVVTVEQGHEEAFLRFLLAERDVALRVPSDLLVQALDPVGRVYQLPDRLMEVVDREQRRHVPHHRLAHGFVLPRPLVVDAGERYVGVLEPVLGGDLHEVGGQLGLVLLPRLPDQASAAMDEAKLVEAFVPEGLE